MADFSGKYQGDVANTIATLINTDFVVTAVGAISGVPPALGRVDIINLLGSGYDSWASTDASYKKTDGYTLDGNGVPVKFSNPK